MELPFHPQPDLSMLLRKDVVSSAVGTYRSLLVCRNDFCYVTDLRLLPGQHLQEGDLPLVLGIFFMQQY